VEEEFFSDGFVEECQVLVAFPVAVIGILALPQVQPLILSSV